MIIARNGRVVLMDEYRTSAMCPYGCGGRMYDRGEKEVDGGSK